MKRCPLLVLMLAALAACGAPPPPALEGRPGGPYRMTLSLDPPAPQPGADTVLTWQLTHASSGEPVTGLDVLHERVMHNFITSLDFTSFAHIHHEDFRPLTAHDLAQARFSLPYRFPQAGRYRIVSEFTHAKRSFTKHFDLLIGDAAAARAPVMDRATVKQVGPYTATLGRSPAQPVAGFETELVLELAKDGRPVTDLALLLGSEVHVAIWRSDGGEFGHAHSYTPHMAMMLDAMHDPTATAATRARRMADMMVQMMDMPPELVFRGPRIPVRYVFPSPGVYQIFLQCAPGGAARVFPFQVEVAAYSAGMDTRIVSMLDDAAAD